MIPEPMTWSKRDTKTIGTMRCSVNNLQCKVQLRQASLLNLQQIYHVPCTVNIIDNDINNDEEAIMCNIPLCVIALNASDSI